MCVTYTKAATNKQKLIMAKKALLMILDGWGIGKHGEGDVIFRTPTPYLDYLNAVLNVLGYRQHSFT